MADKDQGKSAATLSVKVGSDGIYLVVDNPKGEGKISRRDIMEIVERYGIQEINFSLINEIIKSTESHLERKISSNTKITQKHEDLTVEISRDKSAASVRFTPPLNDGFLLDEIAMKVKLKEAGVIYGINEETLKKLVKSKSYSLSYEVARWTPPQDGVDGYLEYFIDNSSNKKLIPKVLEDGKVDYKDLNLVTSVYKGDLLVRQHQAVDGVDGIDVLGQPVSHKKGKMAPLLPKGKGTVIAENGTDLIAEVSGQLLILSDKITIQPILDLKSNIDNTTGNINFNGNIIIRGNVSTGFCVHSEGDIEIEGVVEGAEIIAKGSVTLKSTVQGGDKCVIRAGKDIVAKTITAAKLEAGGSIYADSIMHSDVTCDGEMKLSGKNALLAGGKISVRKQVIAKVIGSNMATYTEIEVGNNPAAIIEYKTISENIAKIQEEIREVDKAVSYFSTLKKQGLINDEKMAQFAKKVHQKIFLSQQLGEEQTRLDDIMAMISQKDGKVCADDVIHNGVKVTIGNATLYVKDFLKHCTLSNEHGKIVVGYYSKD